MYPNNALKEAADRLHVSIVADLNAGMSYMQTAVKNGVSVSTVYEHAKKAGLVTPRKWKPAAAAKEATDESQAL
jgi:transposase